MLGGAWVELLAMLGGPWCLGRFISAICTVCGGIQYGQFSSSVLLAVVQYPQFSSSVLLAVDQVDQFSA